MELVLRQPRGLGAGSGGAFANYYSGDPSDPLRGYCNFIEQQSDLAISEYGPWGCEDLATCKAGGTPPLRGQLHCEQGIRDSSGTQWCFFGGRWFPVGAGCAAITSRAVTDMSQIPMGPTSGACAAGWLRGGDGNCYPQNYAAPQPTTQAMLDANKQAQTIFAQNAAATAGASGGGVPTSLIHGGGLTLVPAPASGVPAWVWLAAGAAMLFLVVKR